MAELAMATDGLLEAFEFGFIRLFVEQPLAYQLYLQADGRGSSYDISAWGDRREFFSWYIEAGYRPNWLEVSVGFGFDPVILDPDRNVYYDTGRIEWLRGALENGIDRTGAVETGRQLLELERWLESNRTLKLECVLSF
jgi:hypothetical protein